MVSACWLRHYGARKASAESLVQSGRYFEDYAPAVAIACLTRCVKALMEEEEAAGEISPERALRAACNALRANACGNHQHRELCAAPQP